MKLNITEPQRRLLLDMADSWVWASALTEKIRKQLIKKLNIENIEVL